MDGQWRRMERPPGKVDDREGLHPKQQAVPDGKQPMNGPETEAKVGLLLN